MTHTQHDETLNTEDDMTERKPHSRNPIARSFGAGINQHRVVPDKKKDRRVKHKTRVFVEGEE